jgi:hypothetical protein
MTADEFDISEPFRQYIFTFLLFDCHRCQKTFSGDPPFAADSSWQWFHDTADQARNEGWYISKTGRCLCPECAKIKGKKISDVASPTI